MSNVPIPFTPQVVNPSHEVAGVELMPHIRKNAMVLYGIFVELTRQFYSDEANPALGTPVKVWRPDEATTDIWIDTELRWEDEHVEKRPAIYISLGPIEYMSLTGRKDALVGYNIQDAEQQFSRSGTGTVSFTHIGGEVGEACALADSTLDYYDAFGRVIRDDFCFTSFAPVQRVPLKRMPPESKDRYGSVVTCKYEVQDKWTLKLESHILKEVTIRAGQQLLGRGIVR